jgi:hypothetical protein
MTTMAETPSSGVDLSALARPIPEWVSSRRNTVRIVYASGIEGAKSSRSLTGRIASASPNEITILRDQTGEPITIGRDRVKSIVVMQEGDVAGRIRVAAVKALINAARALSDTRHVGGNQEVAANQIAFAQELISKLKSGDPENIWDTLQIMGINIE